MPQITKQQALDYIKKVSEGKGIICWNGRVDFRAVYEYLENTEDMDVAVELIKLDANEIASGYFRKRLLVRREGRIERKNLIGRLILANPKVTENRFAFIYDSDLKYLKEHYEDCMGEPINETAIQLIDKSLDYIIERENKEKERREKKVDRRVAT